MKNPYVLIALGILVLVGIYFLSHWKPDNRTNREVAMTCTTDMATEFHIHPVLTIVVGGEQVDIPANIGVTSSCMMALHTHTPDGIIHVESPVQRDFTLGDFFAVWNQDFSKDQLFNLKSDEKNQVTMTVNGIPSDEYENLILRDADQILITYGPVVE